MTDEGVLVTGGTGFLGSHLCERLVERGARVTATRRSSPVPDALRDLDLDWRRMDVLDADAVRETLRGHDRVYHLAGVGLQAAPPETVRRVNAEGTRNVVRAAEAAAVDRLVFASTAGTRKRSAGPADESDVGRPVGAYQKSKATAERVVDAAVDRGLDAVTVHPTSAFGPRDDQFTGRFLRIASDPKFVAHPPGGASFVGAADVARGMTAAMDQGVPGEHYILGGENLTFADALSTIASVVDGSAPPITVPKPVVHAMGPVAETVNDRLGLRMFPFSADMARVATERLFYDSGKARRELGYDYRPFRAVVEDAWDWYVEEYGGE